jgi:hypothetical protein
MREDVFKVIVERPRRGMRLRHLRGRLAGEDDLPVKIGVGRLTAIARARTKSLNENLAPLERYIAKQAGRPWNKVFSEISEHLDMDNTVMAHVRLHLDDFIAIKVAVGRNGEWFATRRTFGFAQSMPWHQRYYVDPNDGIVKVSAKLWRKLGLRDPRDRRKRAKPDDADIRPLDDSRELHRLDGIWFEMSFSRATDGAPDATAYDLLKRATVPASKRHAVAKRQLSRRELAEAGLANRPSAG